MSGGAHRSLCRGRRIFTDGLLDYECDWLGCPVLYADDRCPYRLEDDDRSLPPLGMDRAVRDQEWPHPDEFWP